MTKTRSLGELETRKGEARMKIFNDDVDGGCEHGCMSDIKFANAVG